MGNRSRLLDTREQDAAENKQVEQGPCVRFSAAQAYRLRLGPQCQAPAGARLDS
jgi:hypothetical protein